MTNGVVNIGQAERHTQNRIVQLFQNDLHYAYLGNWIDKTNNSNIEQGLLAAYLTRKGYSPAHITKAIYALTNTANNYNESLYTNNKNVYSKLRYGISVQVEAGLNNETVKLIDWDNPLDNDFAIAEEVTIRGNRDKRPDIVLYVNGIAIGVLELKRSTIDIGNGIRQSIVNQQAEFISDFFSTIQFVFAGNDTQGLRYGTIDTQDKYYLSWKEDIEDNTLLPLDKYLLKMCDKKRIIELMHDFVLFDGGDKKLPRVHQYFGIKAAQEHIARREGGIIWHTQGSGKSIVMVLLAKWILENNPKARVLIVTDRDELDKQIERVFNEAGEPIKRTSSGRDLMTQLAEPTPRMLCSLVHKFGKRDVDNFDAFIKELESQPSHAVGDLFIFVDECHRTQSGKLHRVMKAMLPNALFIGFTGTPLLKKDKSTSLEIFGKYIHTYKYNEAATDGVVLDLNYEARDINQIITAPDRIDNWFEVKTKGLNDFQKFELKKKWGTMQMVLSSHSRMEKVVSDIVFDFNVKPRLSNDKGNAILVASSIYEACRYFELFQKTELKNKCAVITSYNPKTSDITTEDTGANTETDKEFIYKTYSDLLGEKSTEAYEDSAKEKFIKEPANMKLLVVVDKLLTGFDAPSCTYLYIDKSMQDHGLFQAICRVNRLDSDDKQFGYIVDYKDLFKKVENAVAVYTSELDYDDMNSADCDVLLQDRLKLGRERLDGAIEAAELLCEPVLPPKSMMEYLHYFCGNTEIPQELKDREIQRTALYKATVALIRAYANIADDMAAAGYSAHEVEHIKARLDFYLSLRESIRKASGETLDLKSYEADMRYLIDHYIEAQNSKVISPFGDMSLLEIIVKTGIADAINDLPNEIKGSKEAVAETIENNVRSKIIKDHLLDPAYFEEMSRLLDEIIRERKTKAIAYEAYLIKIAELAKQVQIGIVANTPASLNTPAKRAIYNNLGSDEALALQVDAAIKKVKQAAFRGNIAKENVIKAEIYKILNSVDEVNRIFEIIKQQAEY
jgi:type I restriction enzyme, R subunit